MKKLLIILLLLFILGCENIKNTPTSKVENFLSKYQNLDKNVLKDLNRVISKENITPSQKDKYKRLIIKQYQNLSYKILNEKIEDKTAQVDVKIKVLNYKNVLTNKKVSNMNERLKKLNQVDDKITYTITFHLIKKDNTWNLERLDEDTYKKLTGLY